MGFRDKPINYLAEWIERHDFQCQIKSSQCAKGKKRGFHVNHRAKFKMHVNQTPSGYEVKMDYYCKARLGSALAIGVLTGGISAVVGVGTLAVEMYEADKFLIRFWEYADSIAIAPSNIISVERWGNDGKGNMVLQPPCPGTPALQQPQYVPQQASAGTPYQQQPQCGQPQPQYGVPPQQLYGVAPQQACAGTSYQQQPQYVPQQACAGTPNQQQPQYSKPQPPPQQYGIPQTFPPRM